MKPMSSAQVRRLIRISLVDPYLVLISLAFAAVLFAVNQQASLYELRNPRWVLTMSVLILLSPLVHVLFLTRVRAVLEQPSPPLKTGITAPGVYYPQLVIGEILVSLLAGAGMFLLLLPGIYIGLRLSFYKQAVIFDGKSLTAALKESMACTGGWRIPGVILLILSPIYGLEILIGYLVGAFPLGIWGIILAILVSAAGFSLMNTFLTALYLECGSHER